MSNITGEVSVSLQRYMDGFAAYIEAREGRPFESFSSSWYMRNSEGYKAEVFDTARKILDCSSWDSSTIGDGLILSAYRNALGACDNLVDWHNVHPAINNMHDELFQSEEALYSAYVIRDYEKAFEAITSVVGRIYDVLGYTYFLIDRSKFLPIRPRSFDLSFSLLGLDYSMQRRCSWENYQGYIGIFNEIRDCIREYLDEDASLLDAHSFVWMLDVIDAYLKQEDLDTIDEPWKNAVERDRTVSSKARVGQGFFRDNLIDYWGSCAVTGCENKSLLVASHIKPWAVCTRDGEWINTFNGLLLTPGLDAAFDSGLISFTDDGSMLVSEELRPSDAVAAGICVDGEAIDASLTKVDERHKPFLQYHREHVFRG